jgi:hypothetical protein
MGIETLNASEIVEGSFTLVFVVISLIVGCKILFKYRSLKKKELITVGLTWIFMSTVWWSASISFLLIISLDTGLDEFTYLFMGNIFVALALWCWIYSFSNLTYGDSKKILVIIYSILCVLYEIFLIYYFIVDISIIGALEGKFYYHPGTIPMIFQIFAVLTTFVTGIIFSKKSLASEEPKVRLKGRFLLVAFFFFTIGAAMDALLTFTPLTLVIVRLILISSAIFYYIGFLLPERLANRLIN